MKTRVHKASGSDSFLMCFPLGKPLGTCPLRRFSSSFLPLLLKHSAVFTLRHSTRSSSPSSRLYQHFFFVRDFFWILRSLLPVLLQSLFVGFLSPRISLMVFGGSRTLFLVTFFFEAMVDFHPHKHFGISFIAMSRMSWCLDPNLFPWRNASLSSEPPPWEDSTLRSPLFRSSSVFIMENRFFRFKDRIPPLWWAPRKMWLGTFLHQLGVCFPLILSVSFVFSVTFLQAVFGFLTFDLQVFPVPLSIEVFAKTFLYSTFFSLGYHNLPFSAFFG